MNRNSIDKRAWGASLAVGLIVIVLAGCTPAPQRSNAPPQGHTPYQSELNEDYVTMGDNAMLADMVMSPAHFVPHQAELNGLGVRRLNRYAEILKVYGGTLNYEGLTDPQPLLNDRLESIRSFLAACGVGSDQVTVAGGMAGGKGMRATEAGEARSAATFTEAKAAGGCDAGPAGKGGAGLGASAAGGGSR